MDEIFEWNVADLQERENGVEKYTTCRYRFVEKGKTLTLGQEEICEIDEASLIDPDVSLDPMTYRVYAATVARLCISDYVRLIREMLDFDPSQAPWPLTMEVYHTQSQKWLRFTVDAKFVPRFKIKQVPVPKRAAKGKKK